MTKLVKLELTNNKIGDEGAKALAEALLSRGSHPDYQYTLSLDDNEISDAVKQSLRDAVQGSDLDLEV